MMINLPNYQIRKHAFKTYNACCMFLAISGILNNHKHVGPFITSVNLPNCFGKRLDHIGRFVIKIDLGTEGSHFGVES